jgi:hypothetical protein
MKKYLLLISVCLLAVSQLKAESPLRIEKKSYANVNTVEFDHAYGNIIVKESVTKQIELEIQYHDGKNNKAVCDISTSQNTLFIKTILPKNNRNENITIDYIIAIPHNTALTVDLQYGDIKMDDFPGAFKAKLNYSNLNANALTNAKTTISSKYGDVKIGSVNDLTISTEYGNVKLDNAKTLEISNKYSDYKIKQVQNITTGNSSYGNFKVNSAHTINMKLDYSDLIIDNIEASLTVKCNYSDVKINNTSKQLKNIDMKSSFSDLAIIFNPDLSANFEMNVSYGDCKIAKKYNTNYTLSEEKDNTVKKKGTIGSQTPTATIFVSNNYGDVNIK